jgi:hypothetical protein
LKRTPPRRSKLFPKPCAFSQSICNQARNRARGGVTDLPLPQVGDKRGWHFEEFGAGYEQRLNDHFDSCMPFFLSVTIERSVAFGMFRRFGKVSREFCFQDELQGTGGLRDRALSVDECFGDGSYRCRRKRYDRVLEEIGPNSD